MTHSSDFSPAVTFTYPHFLLKVIALCAVLLLFEFLGMLVLAHDGIKSGLIFSLLMLIPLLIGMSLFATGQSDILVDGTGISRLLIGRITRHVAWKDVMAMRVFVDDGEKRRGKYIVHVLRRSEACGSRKIWFATRYEDSMALVNAMNFYIAQAKIKVEFVAHGKTTQRESI